MVQPMGSNNQDVSGQIWNDYDLPNVYSRWVHIEVLSVYGQDYNGFIEVEFYTGTSKYLSLVSYDKGICTYNNGLPRCDV